MSQSKLVYNQANVIQTGETILKHYDLKFQLELGNLIKVASNLSILVLK